MIYYTVYKITNHINGKFYIGKHKTTNLDDGYLGSGIAIKAAIQKYGKENFSKSYLHIFDNEHHMTLAEKILVVVDSSVSYNLVVGGEGSWDLVNELHKQNNYSKEYYEERHAKSKAALIVKHGVDNAGKTEQSIKSLIERNKKPKFPETIEKQRQTLILGGKVRGANNAMFGKFGEQAPCYGRTGELHPMFNTHHSIEIRQKISSNVNLSLPKERVECPICGKSGGKPVMIRFHFDNCKSNK